MRRLDDKINLDGEFIGIREVSQLFSRPIPIQTLWKLKKDGKILTRPFLLGSRRLFIKEDVVKEIAKLSGRKEELWTV